MWYRIHLSYRLPYHCLTTLFVCVLLNRFIVLIDELYEHRCRVLVPPTTRTSHLTPPHPNPHSHAHTRALMIENTTHAHPRASVHTPTCVSAYPYMYIPTHSKIHACVHVRIYVRNCPADIVPSHTPTHARTHTSKNTFEIFDECRCAHRYVHLKL